MFCVKCGTTLPDDSAFCFKCGAPQPPEARSSSSPSEPWERALAPPPPDPSARVSSPLAEPRQLTPPAPARACPTCHQLDQTQKVSVVVEGGTSSNSYSGRVGTDWGAIGDAYSGSSRSHTVLAQRLAAPSRPYTVSPWRGRTKLIVVLLVGFALCPVLGLVTSDGWRNTEGATGGDYFTWLLIVGGPLAIAGIIIRTRGQESRQNDERYRREMSRWNAEIAAWGKLIYCNRCDVVFNPETAQVANSNSIRSLLT